MDAVTITLCFLGFAVVMFVWEKIPLSVTAMIAQSALEPMHLAFNFFDYALIGAPVLIVGIIYFVLIGYKLLPAQPSRKPDDVFNEEKDYSHVASCAYATPIGMPANTMVYNIAGYSFMDYVKVGLPLMVVSTIVSLILLPIFFPFYP